MASSVSKASLHPMANHHGNATHASAAFVMITSVFSTASDADVTFARIVGLHSSQKL